MSRLFRHRRELPQVWFLWRQAYFCRDKHVFVATKVSLSPQKSYLWQLPPMTEELHLVSLFPHGGGSRLRQNWSVCSPPASTVNVSWEVRQMWAVPMITFITTSALLHLHAVPSPNPRSLPPASSQSRPNPQFPAVDLGRVLLTAAPPPPHFPFPLPFFLALEGRCFVWSLTRRWLA